MQMANAMMRFSHVCVKSWYILDLHSVMMMIISAPTTSRPLNGTSNVISTAANECLTTQATYIHFIYTKDFSVFTCAKSQYIPDLDSVLSSTAPH